MTEPPKSLLRNLHWFGQIIARRLTAEGQIQPFTPALQPIVDEAARFLVPSPTLKPHQRIQIYNQQYWYRLLNTLHENFPLLLRLFGYQGFNQQIGEPYLEYSPPCGWSLNHLGGQLTDWISTHYQADDAPLVVTAARLDWAYLVTFLAGEHPPLHSGDPKQLMQQPLALQPHLCLLETPCDVLKVRQQIVEEEPDYWIDHPFPKASINMPFFQAIFRTRKGQVSWKELDPSEFQLLCLLDAGKSLSASCHQLEQESADVDALAAKLPYWVQEWVLRGWLSQQACAFPL